MIGLALLILATLVVTASLVLLSVVRREYRGPFRHMLRQLIWGGPR
jgi:hypothetical protein